MPKLPELSERQMRKTQNEAPQGKDVSRSGAVTPWDGVTAIGVHAHRGLQAVAAASWALWSAPFWGTKPGVRLLLQLLLQVSLAAQEEGPSLGGKEELSRRTSLGSDDPGAAEPGARGSVPGGLGPLPPLSAGPP
ncbi:uncharacterized protein LOC141544494 isoform X4 [Sminthopsis crassicaudata]|uniref:uncharacterized protein LOC141544494 isoform X4 n=1 Tax=Sminthopsis crassicaudata TaxID=9301 RepID=UPI003D683B85